MENVDRKSLKEYLKQIKMDNNNLKHCVNNVKVWLATTKLPHLFTDTLIENYLIRIGSAEVTKQKLERLIIQRYLYPDYIMSFDPADEQMFRDAKAIKIYPLPRFTEKKYRVTIVTKQPNETEYNDKTLLRRCIMMMNSILLEESFEFGLVLLVDWAGFTMNDTTYLLQKCFKIAVICLEKATPFRIKQVVVVNMNHLMVPIIKGLFQLFSEKIRNRIIICSEGAERFSKYVPKKILPLEFGGEEVCMNEIEEIWIKKMLVHRSWFLKDLNLKMDESSVSSYITENNIKCSSPGTYRKFDVD